MGADPLLAASAGVQAFGAYMQQRQENKNLEASARIAEFNADLAIKEGEFAFQAAQQAELEAWGNIRGLIGRQRAAAAGSGVSLASGSVQDLQDDAISRGEHDAAIIRYSGKIAKWRAAMEAQGLRYQAKSARAAKRSPGLSAGLSLLSSAGSYAAAKA